MARPILAQSPPIGLIMSSHAASYKMGSNYHSRLKVKNAGARRLGARVSLYLVTHDSKTGEMNVMFLKTSGVWPWRKRTLSSGRTTCTLLVAQHSKDVAGG